MSPIIDSIAAEFRRYKSLGEAAIGQLSDQELNASPSPNDNSIVLLVWHVAGNLESRFTDFRTSDGEKPWRHRDDEFAQRTVTRTELFEKWDAGWRALLAAIDALSDADLGERVIIRRQPLRIDEALHRSLAHTSYHVGQMVYLAKVLRGEGWRCLSIPRGASDSYNEAPANERPLTHASTLDDASRRNS